MCQICHKASIGNWLAPTTMPSGSVARIEALLERSKEETGVDLRSLILWAAHLHPEIPQDRMNSFFPREIFDVGRVDKVKAAYEKLLRDSGASSFPELVHQVRERNFGPINK